MVANSKRQVRVRFAPSPTGHLHLGTARAIIFNWLFARQHKGTIVFRIEDTDSTRSSPEFEAEIVEALKWLGLDWDEGIEKGGPHAPYRQSERISTYRGYLERLLKEKRAYWCYCTKDELEAERTALLTAGLPAKYNGRCRVLEHPPEGKTPQVIRFHIPEKQVSFDDIIRGKVTFDSSLFGDFVIAKDLETAPLYNFAVVVDDHEMEITHVIRGEDHISNTPKQILIQEAFGFEMPIYAHLPLVLSADKKKLSKRYVETSLLEYRKEGYLPEAINNFLVLLGWHPTDNQEIFSLDELIEAFDLSRVQKAGAVFNTEKLSWVNAQHIKRLSVERLADFLEPMAHERGIVTTRAFLVKVIEAERERVKTLVDFFTLADFFFMAPAYDAAMLPWNKGPASKTSSILEDCYKLLQIFGGEWNRESLRGAIEKLFAEQGNGEVLWPLRVALSHKQASPDPFLIMEVLGKDESLQRIDEAIKKLHA